MPQALGYKFLSNQGHLSPSYEELLHSGLGAIRSRVAARLKSAPDETGRDFLTAGRQAPPPGQQSLAPTFTPPTRTTPPTPPATGDSVDPAATA